MKARWSRMLAVVLCLFVAALGGCHLWYQDMKGYLEHWTGTVSISGFGWSASTGSQEDSSQKDSSGRETIPVNAAITAEATIANPEGYRLDGGAGTERDALRSVRIAGASGAAVLGLAEKVLTGGIKWADSSNNYMESNIRRWLNGNSRRKIGSQTVYPNNWQYSTIRAWLNGSYEGDDTQDKTYDGKGFLQTAFTSAAQNLIVATTVDNSEGSTLGTGETQQANPYVCSYTTDKVFLLSVEEATNLNSGFAVYNTDDSTRIRVTTDYAKVTGANQTSLDGYGGWWWLRSPYSSDQYESLVRSINVNGVAVSFYSVDSTYGGVVPALCVQVP